MVRQTRNKRRNQDQNSAASTSKQYTAESEQNAIADDGKQNAARGDTEQTKTNVQTQLTEIQIYNWQREQEMDHQQTAIEEYNEIQTTDQQIEREVENKQCRSGQIQIAIDVIHLQMGLKENIETNEIKSTAVVKYSVPRPPDFIRLQCNTDLNLPPANWLSSAADLYGLQRAYTLTHRGYTSLRMAQMYPDCVGTVDVIADAEIIKKILKIPYTQETISIFVHRVGNTLLIDNFDIYKTQANDEEYWLRDFVMKHLSAKAIQDERRLYSQIRSREALRNRSLISKFMYHSLGKNEDDKKKDEQNQTHRTSRSVDETHLPNPPDVGAPDSTFDDKYNRNVVWTFEDIEMLLGTDMPIFGGGEYPCISLRLRDMKQPINVLTGIDYWLDNLMSNVPEVVMCYHLNGFVQKYELIKTEDLPQLKNSKFSPQLIKDVAQNILSFLKTNATKAGHTYWLFKDKKDDFIKLYDLTCLVPQNDKLQNPFTIPVAMLLYRVARNFMKSKKKNSGIVKKLLENSIKLLPEHKYPEIITSSYFMLSEIYLPKTTNPEAPTFDKDDPDQDEWLDSKNENLNEENSEEEIKACKPPPPIEGGADYRCLKALSNIHRGLNSLQYFTDEPSEPEGAGMPSARSSDPIPMGYECLSGLKKEDVFDEGAGKVEQGNVKKTNKDMDSTEKGVVKKASKSKKKKAINKNPDLASLLVMNNKNTEPLPTWKKKNARQDGMPWKTHLKILLYEKAVLVFSTLSEYYFGKQQYDNCFRNLKLLARCCLIMRKLNGSIQINENCILGRAGDCCIRIFSLCQNFQYSFQKFRDNIYTHTRKETEMISQLMKDEDDNDPADPPNLHCLTKCDFETPEAVIHLAVVCYEEALKVSETDNMLKRLGNALNETGTYYLNYAKMFYGQEIRTWAKKAEKYITSSLKIFDKIGDVVNMALVNTNLGHMHRLIAYSYSLPGRALTSEENKLYTKSNEYFKRALKILVDRKTNPLIWDNVNWELSCSLFSKACLMHDIPPDDVDFSKYSEKVLKALEDAKNACDMDENHSKFENFQSRIALICIRMASIHHKLFLNATDQVTRESLFLKAQEKYQMAIKYFYEVGELIPYLRAKLSVINLFEEMSKHVHVVHKLELLHSCMEVFLSSSDMLQKKLPQITEEQKNLKPSSETNVISIEETYYTALQRILDTFMQEFLKVNLSILKMFSGEVAMNQNVKNVYTECYRTSLKCYSDKTCDDTIIKVCKVLKYVKETIMKMNFP
ncbi:erythroid differentiation-related factor 1 [Harmonia axyridis]|uniref:erythroid differentiation-related factor 1 n=1 Tax=Harmonia axyridis TaxID=115357 RepID=UPI001E276247|nr:erythroid differentiation-related factor 1 [Harmonia axyridis]